MKPVLRLLAGAAFTIALAIGPGISAALAEVVYNRGAAADPETLDPHKTSTTYEADIMRDLFEGLVMPDSKANLIPGAAESWTVSPDGLVYTFKMRADGKWSNGDPVTADDFVYSMRRMVSKDLAAEYASILYPIKNAEEVNAGTLAPEEMGVKAIDPMTLEITLKGPTPYFLQMLTHQAAYPVHKGSIEKFGADFVKPGNLVSNGPYVLKEFTPNAKVQIVKNPNFHDAANVQIDVVNYIPTEDRSAAIKRYEAGEFDSYGDLPTEQLADLKAKFGDQIRVAPYLGTYYYAIKTDKKPWDNPELRRALSMAIDRDFLAEKIWANSMIPAYSFVPPGMAGYTPATADYANMSQLDREDAAKAILEKLGYTPATPLKLEIRYNTSENHKNTAVAIQDMLKPLGVEVTMLNTDTKTHYGHLKQKGDFDLARAAWIADYQDAQNFLFLAESNNGNNYSQYNNPEYDALMNKAAVTADAAERSKLLTQAEAIFMRDTANIPLLFYSFHNIVSPKLTGWDDNIMDQHPTRFISKQM
jgi:oligopeptide transport system substrate-binding protein